MTNTQFDIKDWGDLHNPDGVDYLGLWWKVTPKVMQTDVQKYVDKMEPMEVPTEQTPFQPKPAFRLLLAHVLRAMSHWLPQL